MKVHVWIAKWFIRIQIRTIGINCVRVFSGQPSYVLQSLCKDKIGLIIQKSFLMENTTVNI